MIGNSHGMNKKNENIKWEETRLIMEKKIEKLFENYNEEYETHEIDWGKPQGKEI